MWMGISGLEARVDVEGDEWENVSEGERECDVALRCSSASSFRSSVVSSSSSTATFNGTDTSDIFRTFCVVRIPAPLTVGTLRGWLSGKDRGSLATTASDVSGVLRAKARDERMSRVSVTRRMCVSTFPRVTTIASLESALAASSSCSMVLPYASFV